MKQFLVFKNLKKASFTIEAAYIIPLTAIIIVLLIGFNFHTHERVRNKAAAYEAALFASSGSETRAIAEERIRSCLEQAIRSDPLDVSTAEADFCISDPAITVNYSGSVLSEVFGSLFSNENSIRVDVIHAVRFKRLEWIAKYAL